MSAAASAPRRLLRSSAPKQQPKQQPKQPKQQPKQPKQQPKQPKQQPKQQREEQREEQEDASRMHGFERLLDVNFAGEQWAEARVLDLDAAQRRLLVHYMGWNARYDAWIGLDVIAAHGAHTKAAPKKKTSWDGKQSLFEVGDGPAATHSKRKRPSPRARLTAKAKTDSRKRKTSEDASSSQADVPTVKSPRAARKQEKPAAEDGATVNDPSSNASPKAVRVTRSRAAKVKTEPVSVRDAPAINDKSNGTAEDADGHTETPSEGEKVTPIEVRLPTRRRAASKQKSRTKKKNDDESSTSEYSDHEDSEVEEEDDASDDEELQELRKRRKRIENGEESEEELVELDFETKRPAKSQRVSTRRGTSKANVPHQRVPLACAESAATRERLADYFRQRVFQQQLMHVARVEQTAPVVPIAPPPTGSTAKKPSQSRKAADQSESKEEADPASAQASISEAQLAAYYHYQMMLAQAYMAADPKELQARAAAFEEQRRLQVEAYYRQLEATREKNAKSIDDAQEFMDKSTETWEKQTQSLMDPTSSGGAGALRNWDEMAKSLQNGKPKEEEDDGDDSKASKKPEGETDGEAERDADKSDDGEDSAESPADASARELVRVGEQKAKPDAELAKAAGKPSGASGDVLYEFVL